MSAFIGDALNAARSARAFAFAASGVVLRRINAETIAAPPQMSFEFFNPCDTVFVCEVDANTIRPPASSGIRAVDGGVSFSVGASAGWLVVR